MFTAQDAQLPFCQNRLQRYNKKMTYTSKNRKIAHKKEKAQDFCAFSLKG